MGKDYTYYDSTGRSQGRKKYIQETDDNGDKPKLTTKPPRVENRKIENSVPVVLP
jgi:hypothetical protein